MAAAFFALAARRQTRRQFIRRLPSDAASRSLPAAARQYHVGVRRS